jgi:hypothetical protein
LQHDGRRENLLRREKGEVGMREFRKRRKWRGWEEGRGK